MKVNCLGDIPFFQLFNLRQPIVTLVLFTFFTSFAAFVLQSRGELSSRVGKRGKIHAGVL